MYEWFQVWGPEIVGYVGMVFVLLSFLMRNIRWLRILNIIGGTFCCVYGIITKTYPTAILNGLLVAINLSMPIRWFISEKKNHKDKDKDNVN